MEKQRIIQALQQELHAIAERNTANAQSFTRIAQLIGRLDLSSISDEEPIFGFQFPVNDYGYLVHMLTTHPWLKSRSANGNPNRGNATPFALAISPDGLCKKTR